MSVGYWIMLIWGVGGFISGLFAANYCYIDPQDRYDIESGTRALAAFCAILIAFPLALLGGTCYFLVCKGAWLLPAYRKVQRNKRLMKQLVEAKKQLSETDKLRQEVDELHRKIGIPEVDWTGQS